MMQVHPTRAITTEESAMKHFLAKFADSILCVLGCFDRLLFKGYLPIAHPTSMEHWLDSQGILLKDFKRVGITQSDMVGLHATSYAQKAARLYLYLRRPPRKDDEARRIAEQDGIREGLICVFAIVEQAQSFQLRYGEGRPRLICSQPRGLCLYFYFLDRDFGLMHVRLQTWFPFTIQIYVNGHSWLARQLDRRGLRYQAADNAFTSLADPARTQKLADKLLPRNWPRILSVFARRVNPCSPTGSKTSSTTGAPTRPSMPPTSCFATASAVASAAGAWTDRAHSTHPPVSGDRERFDVHERDGASDPPAVDRLRASTRMRNSKSLDREARPTLSLCSTQSAVYPVMARTT
jgi:hypothetical protein